MKLVAERNRRGEAVKLTPLGMVLAALAVIIVILLAATLAFRPFKKTPADKIALSYGGGMFEGNEFQSVVQPASGIRFNGWFDKWYEYPITQRDYTVSQDPGESDKGADDAINAATSDGVDCSVQLIVTFKLNTNHIREFHETIGLKFKAWEDSGWDQMLNKNLRQPLENAVQQECRRFSSTEIRKNPEVIKEVAKGVSTGLKSSVNTLLGGDDFFCGPEFKVGEDLCPDFQVVVKSITLPSSVNDSLAEQVTSENRVITATNNAKSKEQEALGEKAAKDAVAPALTPEYLAYLRIQAETECAKSQNCTLVITPGSGVNVNVGQR